jgi:hypothetical protein
MSLVEVAYGMGREHMPHTQDLQNEQKGLHRYSPSNYRHGLKRHLETSSCDGAPLQRVKRCLSFSEWLKATSLKLIKPFIRSLIMEEKEEARKEESIKEPSEVTSSKKPLGGIDVEKRRPSVMQTPTMVNEHVHVMKEEDILFLSSDDRILKECTVKPGKVVAYKAYYQGDSFITTASLKDDRAILLPAFRRVSRTMELPFRMTKSKVKGKRRIISQEYDDNDEFFERLHRKYEKLEKQAVRRDREQQLHELYKELIDNYCFMEELIGNISLL